MANTGNTQQQINYGAAANDGQGDPLRTAFIKTDDNFDAIWNTGPVGSNITILNNVIQSNNVNGNIVIRPNGVGVIQANASILPNTANLRDLGSTGQRWRAAYIGSGGLSVDGNVTVTGNLTAGNISYTGNVFVGDLQGSVYADDSTIMVDAVDNEMFASAVTFGRANVSGNVTANYFIGNGSQLTGIASSYGNANVATYLASGFGTIGSNSIVTNGNIVASELDVGYITNEFPIGIQTNGGGVWEFAGNILRGPQGGTWTSDADTSYFNSPANGFLNLSSLQNGNVVSELFMEHSFIRFFIDNGIDATWEMKADGRTEFPSYTFPYEDGNAGEVLKTDGSGNLAWTTDSSDYGNANVATFLTAFGSNTISTTGNVSAGNISTGQGLVQSLDITADGIINAGALNVNSSAVPGATGNITGGNLSVTGNVTGNTAGFAIGYRDIPQVAFTGNATIATADAGKHFYSTQSTDYILTIANNASQGFQTGAAITVINQGTGNITLAQGSGVTLYLTGNATSGNRTVTTFGMATLIKVATDTWFVSGAGVI